MAGVKKGRKPWEWRLEASPSCVDDETAITSILIDIALPINRDREHKFAKYRTADCYLNM